MRVGITGFQPERLTQLREARGLSKINLGRLVDRSPLRLQNGKMAAILPMQKSLRSWDKF